MNNNIIIDKIFKLLSNFGWWLYVKTYWRHNKSVQKILTAEKRDNLGYFLSHCFV